MDLEHLMQRPESKTLEFKRDLSSPKLILRTACAFANSAGGTILFGIEDRTGVVRGIDDPLDQAERLASIMADGIHPHIVPEIDIARWRNVAVIALHVHPGPSRPYHVKSQGWAHGTYVRVGSTNRAADEALVAELGRSATGVGFDETPVADATVADIDTEAVQRAFSGKRTGRLDDLRALRIVTRHGHEDLPTTGGMLLFGRGRTERFPDAWIQAARFKGLTRSHVIDSAAIRDYPVFALKDALSFIARNTSLAYEYEDLRRIEVPEYPAIALREALVNAIAHADYSQPGSPIRVSVYADRCEIESPGLLPPGLSLDDAISGVSRIRNRVITRVLLELELIEQLGTGLAKIRDACAAAGLEPPLFEEVATHFRVTLKSGRIAPPAATNTVDASIIDALRASEGLGTSAIAEAVGRTTRATRSRLRRLVDQGLVVEIGSGPNDPQRTYHVAEDPARYRTRTSGP